VEAKVVSDGTLALPLQLEIEINAGDAYEMYPAADVQVMLTLTVRVVLPVWVGFIGPQTRQLGESVAGQFEAVLKEVVGVKPANLASLVE